jgi:hypothetical protein
MNIKAIRIRIMLKILPIPAVEKIIFKLLKQKNLSEIILSTFQKLL